jgi:hypothetical protein
MESLLGKEEVLSGKSKIMAQKDHNFWSDRWITLKFLQEFPDVVFFGVAMESLRVD